MWMGSLELLQLFCHQEEIQPDDETDTMESRALINSWISESNQYQKLIQWLDLIVTQANALFKPGLVRFSAAYKHILTDTPHL